MHMIDWEQLQAWQGDWLDPHPDAIKVRKQFLEGSLHVDRWLLTLAIQDVRAARLALLTNYAYGFVDQLGIDSSAASTPHLEILLELANKPGSNETIDRHRWFDAISLFDQAVAIAKIEQSDPMESVGRDTDGLIDFLDVRLFLSGFEPTTFVVYHDPANDYMVGPDDIGIGRALSHRAEGRMRRTHRLTCRRATDNGLIFLDHRNKLPFHVWLKMQRQVNEGRVQNPYVVRDRCGLTFAAKDRDSCLAFAQRVEKVLCKDGAHLTEPLDNNFDRTSSADIGNHESAPTHRFAKMSISWRGREFELQFMALFDHFNAGHSLSAANHELYRLRQATMHFFPKIWPAQIYGIQWRNPRTRHQLRSWKIAQLGWRVNGDH